MGGTDRLLFTDINAARQRTWSEDSQGRDRAVVWKQGKPLNLNYAIAPGSGWALEYARAISETGQIKGVGKRKEQSYIVLLTPR